VEYPQSDAVHTDYLFHLFLLLNHTKMHFLSRQMTYSSDSGTLLSLLFEDLFSTFIFNLMKMNKMDDIYNNTFCLNKFEKNQGCLVAVGKIWIHCDIHRV
jgi:hypothetical protein